MPSGTLHSYHCENPAPVGLARVFPPGMLPLSRCTVIYKEHATCMQYCKCAALHNADILPDIPRL